MNPHHLVSLPVGHCTAVLLAVGVWLTVQAGPAQAQSAAIASSQVSRCEGDHTYKTKKGDTVKKLLTQLYPGSPLKEDRLLQALLAANPPLAQDKSKALRPGACLNLPDHRRILMQTLTEVLSPEEMSDWASEVTKSSGLSPGSDWVRYP